MRIWANCCFNIAKFRNNMISMTIPSCYDNDNIDDDDNWVPDGFSVDSSISVKIKPRAIFKIYILLLVRSLGKRMAKYNGSKFWTSKLTFTKKKKKKKHLSVTYIDFPRKCDPLIYTYQSARFIFFHEIFVNFNKFVCLFVFCFLFFCFVFFFFYI